MASPSAPGAYVLTSLVGNMLIDVLTAGPDSAITTLDTLATFIGSGGGGVSGPVAATTLSASSTVSLSPANKNVTISPTGTGTVTVSPASTVAISPTGALTISPTAASTMNNVAIGGTTPLAGKFTAATATSLAVTGNVSADATKLGFYGTTSIVQQTGVAVTAGGIHAALVNLGLITA